MNAEGGRNNELYIPSAGHAFSQTCSGKPELKSAVYVSESFTMRVMCVKAFESMGLYLKLCMKSKISLRDTLRGVFGNECICVHMSTHMSA